MPGVSHTEPVDAPADAVWRLVGDFAERCDDHDDAARSLAYTVVAGNPLPVTSCSGRVQVVDADDGRSEVHWTITYETDADPDAVARDLGGLLQASAGALRAAAER